MCYKNIGINFSEESAATEKAWKNAGGKVGLQIWRIVVCLEKINKIVSLLNYLPFLMVFSSYIVVVSFIGGGNRSTQRKPLACYKSLTNLITYSCIEYTSLEWDLNSQH
jgi:hypothetical protein